jgi:hypothetical protein
LNSEICDENFAIYLDSVDNKYKCRTPNFPRCENIVIDVADKTQPTFDECEDCITGYYMPTLPLSQ